MDKEQNPLITTIIPTYKRPHFLKRAIKSVLTQTYKNLQVCVFDNASGDETKEVVTNFAKKDPRVKYFCHETNIGSLKNWKFGLSKVRTPFFSFLSDDDFLFPEFYELGLQKLFQYPEAAIFIGNCITASSSNNIINIALTNEKEGLYSPSDAVSTFVCKTNVQWSSMLFKKEMVEGIQLQDNIKISDIDYLTKIFYKYPVIVSKQYCGVFFAHSSAYSATWKVEDIWPAMGKTVAEAEKNSPVSDEIKKETESRVKKEMLYFVYKQGIKSIFLKNKEELDLVIKILENDFNRPDLIKKLNVFQKIKILPLIGPTLLRLRRFYLWHLSNRFSPSKKNLINLQNNLNLNSRN